MRRGTFHRATDQMRDPEAGQPFAALADEDGKALVGSQAPLAAERAKSLREIGCEWHASVLAPLAAEQDLVGRLQPQIGSIDPDGLRDPRPRAREEEQEGV